MSSKKQLPGDPDGQNNSRAHWAALAITAFTKATKSDEEDALSDLLADLMHWCDRQEGQSFKAALKRARENYAAETLG